MIVGTLVVLFLRIVHRVDQQDNSVETDRLLDFPQVVQHLVDGLVGGHVGRRPVEVEDRAVRRVEQFVAQCFHVFPRFDVAAFVGRNQPVVLLLFQAEAFELRLHPGEIFREGIGADQSPAVFAEHQMRIRMGREIVTFVDDAPDRILILRLGETDARREKRAFHAFFFQRIEDRDNAVEVLEIAAVVFAVVRCENQIDILLVRIYPPDDTDIVFDEYRCFLCSLPAAARHQ